MSTGVEKKYDMMASYDWRLDYRLGAFDCLNSGSYLLLLLSGRVCSCAMLAF